MLMGLPRDLMSSKLLNKMSLLLHLSQLHMSIFGGHC